MSQTIQPPTTVAIIGSGPAALIAAEMISRANIQVHVFERMPSVARKFLLAGIGGLNLTHSESLDLFCSRYSPPHILDQHLQQFGATQLIQWCHQLGIETFIGSSGRIFPKQMKAAPLLRAWLQRLKQQGVQFYVRHTWQGWQNQQLLFTDATGTQTLVKADATLLALGGASYPRLGTDGQWVNYLQSQHIKCNPWQPSNCGFETEPWSSVFIEKYAGSPIKNIIGTFTDQQQTYQKQGELLVTKQGLEGGLMYALSSKIREQIIKQDSATLYLDLFPQYSLDKLQHLLAKPKGNQSLSNYLRKQINLQGVKLGLVRELAPHSLNQLELLAPNLKALPVKLIKPRPIAEAISTAGGVCFTELNKQLMLHKLPSVFCAGEMLDWDAPTGGYLLTGCFSTGYAAAQGIIEYLQTQLNKA